jgi:hypothetical protein
MANQNGEYRRETINKLYTPTTQWNTCRVYKVFVLNAREFVTRETKSVVFLDTFRYVDLCQKAIGGM